MAFNEMLGSDGQVRAPYAGVAKWLESVNVEQLDRRLGTCGGCHARRSG